MSPAHRSRDRGRMTIHEYPGTRHVHKHVPAKAPRSERAHSAPCLGAPLCSPRSTHRSDASNAAGPAVAAYRTLHTQPGPASLRHRGARQAPPRSALRASLGHPHLAQRVARALQTQPGRQWQRTAGIAARGRPHSNCLAPLFARSLDCMAGIHMAIAIWSSSPK